LHEGPAAALETCNPASGCDLDTIALLEPRNANTQVVAGVHKRRHEHFFFLAVPDHRSTEAIWVLANGNEVAASLSEPSGPTNGLSIALFAHLITLCRTAKGTLGMGSHCQAV
jgi:hypothetical protein